MLWYLKYCVSERSFREPTRMNYRDTFEKHKSLGEVTNVLANTYNLTRKHSHASQNSQICSFAESCPLMHQTVAFEEPCCCTHGGIASVHDGILHPSLNQCWKTLMFINSPVIWRALPPFGLEKTLVTGSSMLSKLFQPCLFWGYFNPVIIFFFVKNK